MACVSVCFALLLAHSCVHSSSQQNMDNSYSLLDSSRISPQELTLSSTTPLLSQLQDTKNPNLDSFSVTISKPTVHDIKPSRVKRARARPSPNRSGYRSSSYRRSSTQRSITAAVYHPSLAPSRPVQQYSTASQVQYPHVVPVPQIGSSFKPSSDHKHKDKHHGPVIKVNKIKLPSVSGPNIVVINTGGGSRPSLNSGERARASRQRTLQYYWWYLCPSEGKVRSSEYGTCHYLLERGPCNASEWFVFRETPYGVLRPACRHRPLDHADSETFYNFFGELECRCACLEEECDGKLGYVFRKKPCGALLREVSYGLPRPVLGCSGLALVHGNTTRNCTAGVPRRSTASPMKANTCSRRLNKAASSGAMSPIWNYTTLILCFMFSSSGVI